jgi:polyprenyl-phospho-N-acetylgalactosaminyl synthase
MINNNIFIIVPCFNDNSIIRKTIIELLNKNYKVIIVDDGSREEIFSEIVDLDVYYLRHQINLGQGAALQTGMDYAKTLGAQTVVHYDADGQHSIEDIPHLLENIKTGYDIVLCSRFLRKEDHCSIPLIRWLILKIAVYVNFVFTGLLLSDAHNGLRALNCNAMNKIYITENRMAHATEIVKQIKLNKLKYIEIPNHINYTPYSLKKGQKNINSLNIFIDLIIDKLL